MGTRAYSVLLPAPYGGFISCVTQLTHEQRDHYRACGYEVNRLVSTIPQSVVDSGFAPVWLFAQSLFNFDLGHYFKRNT